MSKIDKINARMETDIKEIEELCNQLRTMLDKNGNKEDFHLNKEKDALVQQMHVRLCDMINMDRIMNGSPSDIEPPKYMLVGPKGKQRKISLDFTKKESSYDKVANETITHLMEFKPKPMKEDE